MTSKHTLPPTRMKQHRRVSFASSVKSLLPPSIGGHGPVVLCHCDTFLGTPTAGRSVINCRCYYCPELLWSLSLHCQITATFYLRGSDSGSVHVPQMLTRYDNWGYGQILLPSFFLLTILVLLTHFFFRFIVTNNTVHRKPRDSSKLFEKSQELLI